MSQASDKKLLAKLQAQLAKEKGNLKASQTQLTQVKATNPNSGQRADAAYDEKQAAKARGHVPVYTSEVDKYFFEKTGSGKTQAQVDALANANKTATEINTMGPGFSSKVDSDTGKVITTTPKPITSTSTTIVSGDPHEGEEGYYFNTTTGKWTKIVTDVGSGAGDGAGGGGGDGSLTLGTGKPETNITVLKSLLHGLGFSKTLVDSSTQFLLGLLGDDLDYDNAISVFTDSKDYTLKNGTKMTSPFYEQYGYLNEGLSQTKSAAELFNFVEGAKSLVSSYGVNSKFASPESLKKYVKNNVTVARLDERMMAAKLRTTTADPQYVATLKKLGYISGSEDLTDFYLDPTIGQEQLEINRRTAAFGAEALRRSNAKTGITFDADAIKARSAELAGQGRTEAQIGDLASQGYETISEQLQPLTGLSNVYESQYGKQEAVAIGTIQKELEAEQFSNMASQRRKKLTELQVRDFQATSGKFQGNSRNISGAR